MQSLYSIALQQHSIKKLIKIQIRQTILPAFFIRNCVNFYLAQFQHAWGN